MMWQVSRQDDQLALDLSKSGPKVASHDAVICSGVEATEAEVAGCSMTWLVWKAIQTPSGVQHVRNARTVRKNSSNSFFDIFVDFE